MNFRRYLFLILLLSAWATTHGQWDKNYYRPETQKISWQLLTTDHFNFYFTEGFKSLSEEIAFASFSRLEQVEKKIGYRLSGRVDIYIYPNLESYNRSYVGQKLLHSAYNQGGVTEIAQSNVYTYFEGSKHLLMHQITEGISRNLVQEMLYGGTLQERIKYATLLHLPVWFEEGLIKYLSKDWDAADDNQLRDAFYNGSLASFEKLNPEMQTLVGSSMWSFMYNRKGPMSIQRILYLVRLSRKVETALYFVFDWSSKDLYREWFAHYELIYSQDLKRSIPSYGLDLFEENKLSRHIHQIEISPDGNKLAIAYNSGIHELVLLYNRETEERTVLFERDDWYFGKPSDQSLLVQWENSEHLFLAENAEKPTLYRLDLTGQKLETWTPDLDGILDFEYDQKAKNFVIAGMKNGSSHIYLYDDELHPLTESIHDDVEICLDNQSNIYFTRISYTDTVVGHVFQGQKDILFIIRDGKEVFNVTNITNTPLSDEFQPLKISGSSITFLSDKNGISNAYVFNLHQEIFPVSNYRSGIIYHSFSENREEIAEIVLLNGNQNVFISETSSGEAKPYGSELVPTFYSAIKAETQAEREDSTETLVPEDSVYNEPIFFQTMFPVPDNVDSLEQLEPEKKNQIRDFYDTSREYSRLSIDQLVTQLNNDHFISRNYPGFLRAGSYLPNRAGFVLGISLTDQFKNQRLTGLVKMNVLFNHFEFKAAYDAKFKKNRLSVEAFRDAFLREDDFILQRYRTGGLNTRWSRNIHKNHALTLYNTTRNDVFNVLSDKEETLLIEDDVQWTTSLGLEWSMNHSYYTDERELQGFLAKANLESQSNFNGVGFLAGFQALYGHRIGNYVQFSHTLHIGTSFGALRNVFFLGGAVGQVGIEFSPENSAAGSQPLYNVPVYGVEGFNINVRNGNSFSAYQMEVASPFHMALVKKPMRSNFMKSLNTVLWFNIGSAWYGGSPYSPSNPANITTINSGDVVIEVFNRKNPLVYSFGPGIKAKLWGYNLSYKLAFTMDNSVLTRNIHLWTIGTRL
jgi:hypothetical protein